MFSVFCETSGRLSLSGGALNASIRDFSEAKRVALSMLDEAVKRSKKGGAK